MKFNHIRKFDIDRVICVCAKKDLTTFTLASKYIVANIHSREYVVIVPSDEVSLFTDLIDNRFKVVDEEIYSNFFIKNLRKYFLVDSPSSINWYIQQLLKLSALSEADDDEIFLIWDADTLPLKKLIFTEDEKVGHYKSTEFHQEYFNFIKLTLGLEKEVPYSFVAQCIAVKGKWFKEFTKAVELHNNSFWINAIIEGINFNRHSAFSEYETLGTFISARFKNEIYTIDNKWYRFGNSTFGDIKKIDTLFMRFIFNQYDFVSFEAWDSKKIKRKLQTLASAVIFFLGKMVALK